MTEPLQSPELFPDVAVEAIRKPYPHPRKKAAEMAAIRKALERLVGGESGTAMTPAEAIAFLRAKTDEARQAFALRAKAYTPHLTTWMNQRKYLTNALPTPEHMEDAISILAAYPTIPAVNVDAHMPILRVIDEHIRYLKATQGSAAASYIRTRTMRFAEIVNRWPEGEMQFIPGADRFFKERRYEQDERQWVRTAKAGFESERQQLQRIV